MSKEKDAPENPFEAIADAHTEEYLNGIAARPAKAMIWTQDQKHILSTKITSYQKQGTHYYVCFEKQTKENHFIELMEENGITSAYIHVSLPDAQIFFRGDLRQEDRAFYNFRIQRPIYKAQRRRDLRVPIPEAQNIQAVFSDSQGNSHQKKILDLSSGGLVFLSKDKIDFFKQGQIITDLKFKLHGREISCEAEIRHVKEIQYSGAKREHKIGIQFKKLSEEDQDLISAYVFEESRRFLGRI